MRRAWIASLALTLLACGGSDRLDNEIEGPAHSPAQLEARDAAQREASVALSAKAGVERTLPAKQILFGDLHVHTTYSPDAFTLALPIMGGEGTHTLADACDFARYCAELDFFSHNDHAESLIPEHWAATKQAVRRCNASAGEPESQDLMAFAGWEWTQVGHHTRDALGTQECRSSSDRKRTSYRRDPSTPAPTVRASASSSRPAAPPMARFLDPPPLESIRRPGRGSLDRLEEWPECPRDVPTRDLPPDCHENAPTPEVLYPQARRVGLRLPGDPPWHGLGLVHSPARRPGTRRSLAAQHDPGEGASGRDHVRATAIARSTATGSNFDEVEGELVCPGADVEDFLPCCWRAGELMRERCGDLPAEECEARVDGGPGSSPCSANVTPAYVFPG